MPRLLYLTIALALVTIVGCGDAGKKTYPVHGVVRFPDGKLLRRGTVEFELISRENPSMSTAEIHPDGSFTMGTNDLDDGAVAGTYRAVVIADHRIGNGFERPGLIPPPIVHERYRDFLTSKLQFEVKEETNHFVIDVDYAPKTTEQEATPQ